MADETHRSDDKGRTTTSTSSQTPVVLKREASEVKSEPTSPFGEKDRSSNADIKGLDGHEADAESRISKQPDTADDNDNPFDFGGLPNRNLKKNLGCG